MFQAPIFPTTLRRLASAALAAAVFGLASPSAAQVDGVMSAEQFSALTAQAEERGTVRVIVQLDVPTALAADLSAAQIDAQQAAIASAQARFASAFDDSAINRTYVTMPLVAMTLTAAQLERLQSMEGVASVQADGLSAPSLQSTTRITRARRLWARGQTGHDTVVAVLDSGISYNNRAFRPHSQVITNSACFSTTDAEEGSTSACRQGLAEQIAPWAAYAQDLAIAGAGHGTHVAGIVASRRNNSLRGMAPDAMLYPIQVFSVFTLASGYCNVYGTDCMLSWTSDQLAALEHIYQMRNTYTFASVNMSLGGGSYSGSCNTDFRADIIAALRAAGIAVVIASGNNGYVQSVGAPSCISAAITVGATDDDDNIASFSNQSASLVDLMAPGVNVEAAYPPTRTSTDFLSGTSMATPHVAGAFALLRSEFPAATVDLLEQALECTGVYVTRDGTVGSFPRINLRAARAFLHGYSTAPGCPPLPGDG